MFKELIKKQLTSYTGRSARRGDVGLELEIEGYGLPSDAPHWQAKSEGSLIDGMEYITKPIKADAVKLYVDNLRRYMEECGASVKNSYRCSTHVHVNFSNDPVEDMLGMFVIFTMFEPLFLTLCGASRNGNLFCLSSYDTGDAVHSFQKLCNTILKASSNGFAFQRGKYSALNLDRLCDLGTVEARCFPLSVDGDTVQIWVNWLMNMKQMAKGEIDKTYRTLWKQVRQNPHWYANIIFGEMANVSNLDALMDFGTQGAYELTRVLKKAFAHETPAKAEGKLRVKTIVDDYAVSVSEDTF